MIPRSVFSRNAFNPGTATEPDDDEDMTNAPPLPATPQPHPPTTHFARKYGVSKDQTPFLKETGKSGLTPLTPLKQDLKYLRAHAPRYEYLSGYQRDQLRGFTTQGLIDLGCFNDDDVQKCDLGLEGSPIHPLLEKHRWKSDEEEWHGVPGNVFGDGGGGLFGKVRFASVFPVIRWEGNNDVIWKVIEPSVRLASKFLANQTLLPWLDALLIGRREPILPRDYPRAWNPPFPNIFKFYRRSPIEVFNSRNDPYIDATSFLDKYADKIRYVFESNTIHGQTTWTPESDDKDVQRLTVHFNTWNVESLLWADLSDSERVVQQFNFAVVILHELAHALCIMLKYEHINDPAYTQAEPFFEDETIAEVGYSLETSMFGGIIDPIIYIPEHRNDAWLNREPPPMAIILENFPGLMAMWRMVEKEEDWIRDQRCIINGVQTAKRTPNEDWPIPIKAVENFLHTEFWDACVRNKSYSVLKIPKVVGASRTERNDPHPNVLIGEDWLRHKHIANLDQEQIFGGHWDVWATNRLMLDETDIYQRLAVRFMVNKDAERKSFLLMDQADLVRAEKELGDHENMAMCVRNAAWTRKYFALEQVCEGIERAMRAREMEYQKFGLPFQQPFVPSLGGGANKRGRSTGENGDNRGHFSKRFKL